MAINDPVYIEYMEKIPGEKQAGYVARRGPEWLWNREPDRPFVVDGLVWFRDPDQMLIYLEKFHPLWFAAVEFDEELRKYLDDLQSEYAAYKPPGPPVAEPDEPIQGQLF